MNTQTLAAGGGRFERGMQQEWCPAAQDMVRIASAAIAKAGGGND